MQDAKKAQSALQAENSWFLATMAKLADDLSYDVSASTSDFPLIRVYVQRFRAAFDEALVVLPPTNAGVDWAGSKWFLGAPSESCTQACAKLGLSGDPSTTTFAANNINYCSQVGIALGLGAASGTDPCANAQIGCSVCDSACGQSWVAKPLLCTSAATLDAIWAERAFRRICACK